jgi:SAM-dependent methyltransferase
MHRIHLSVPVYLPEGLYRLLRRAKRALVPRQDIHGEGLVKWSFISAEMPSGPGKALEFGCEQGYLSLLAARRGFEVTALDLQPQFYLWSEPRVQFLQGDLLELALPANTFDLIINCSSVEHVGIAGRYGITADHNDGDIEVMQRLADILKPEGRLLMTAPCGREAIRHGTHGIALFNAERQLIWGRALNDLDLPPGLHQFEYEFPVLPVRPGPYSWLLSLFDDRGQVDMWGGVREMVVTTEPHQHYRDEWSGILNVPSTFSMRQEKDSVAVSARPAGVRSA